MELIIKLSIPSISVKLVISGHLSCLQFLFFDLIPKLVGRFKVSTSLEDVIARIALEDLLIDALFNGDAVVHTVALERSDDVGSLGRRDNELGARPEPCAPKIQLFGLALHLFTVTDHKFFNVIFKLF